MYGKSPSYEKRMSRALGLRVAANTDPARNKSEPKSKSKSLRLKPFEVAKQVIEATDTWPTGESKTIHNRIFGKARPTLNGWRITVFLQEHEGTLRLWYQERKDGKVYQTYLTIARIDRNNTAKPWRVVVDDEQCLTWNCSVKNARPSAQEQT